MSLRTGKKKKKVFNIFGNSFWYPFFCEIPMPYSYSNCPVEQCRTGDLFWFFFFFYQKHKHQKFRSKQLALIDIGKR